MVEAARMHKIPWIVTETSVPRRTLVSPPPMNGHHQHLNRINHLRREPPLPQQREAYFRSLVQNPLDMISILDTQGIIRHISPASERILGYSPQELLNSNLLQFVHLEDRPQLQRFLLNANQEHGMVQVPEFRWRHKQGYWVDLESVGNTVDNFNVQVLVLHSRDIIQRKRAEKESQLLKALTHVISESHHFNNTIRRVLQTICELTQWKLGEAWMPNDDQTALYYAGGWSQPVTTLEYFQEVSQSLTFSPGLGIPGRIWLLRQAEWYQDLNQMSEDAFPRRQAAYQAGLKSAFGLPIMVQNQVLGVCVFFMLEASEEDPRLIESVSSVAQQLSLLLRSKWVEQELRRAERKYRSIFENAIEGIFQTTPEGRYLSANPALARIYGYESPADLMRNLTNIQGQLYVNSTRRQEFIQLMNEWSAVSDFQSQVYRKDGTVIWISENVRVVRDEQGKILYYEGSVEDITERKTTDQELKRYAKQLQTAKDQLELQTVELAGANARLRSSEAELSELNASKNKFFSILSHDLRSPFTTLLGMSEMMSNQLEYLEPPEIKDFSWRIFTSAQKLMKLIDNLLQWSSLQNGRMPYTPFAQSLSAIVQDNLLFLQSTAEAKQIQLIAEIPEEIWVNVDRFMCNSLVQNLIANAIKFTHSGGQILLKAEQNNASWVEVMVKDSGVGMTPEDLQRLFKIEEVHSTEGTAREKGSGLGLVLCKELIEKHGGKIWAESQLGQGSTFHFTLPSASANLPDS